MKKQEIRLIDAEALHTHKFLTPQVKVIGGRHNGKTREQIIEAYQKGWNDCIDAIIDNAPTVEPRIEYGADGQPYRLFMSGGQVVPDMLQGLRYEERPQGEWISQGNTGGIINHGMRCSICGKVVEFSENFCPGCGADMRGEE